jgi:DNA-binding MarR family transcriptional regulator
MLKRLNQQLARAGYQVTHEQWVILMHLLHSNGQCQSRLVHQTDKDKAAITKLIDGLEKKGLVERRPDSNDRRNKLIYLTEEGRQLQLGSQIEVDAIFQVATTNVDPADLLVFNKVLKQITENLTF